MEMSSNLNMVSSPNTVGIQGQHQMMQQQPMQSPLMSHSPMGSLQNKPIVQQMNRQQPQQNQLQIGQPPVMMPHQQSQQMQQMNQMQQRPTSQPQQLQQQQSQPQMGYQNYYANFGNR